MTALKIALRTGFSKPGMLPPVKQASRFRFSGHTPHRMLSGAGGDGSRDQFVRIVKRQGGDFSIKGAETLTGKGDGLALNRDAGQQANITDTAFKQGRTLARPY